MGIQREKILIIDEAGFSRVCSAILESEGFCAEAVAHQDAGPLIGQGAGVGLVITSYPYGSRFFDEIEQFSLPTIVLTDHISRELLAALERFEHSICMIKPLDYPKFKSLVRQFMNGDHTHQGGYSIV